MGGQGYTTACTCTWTERTRNAALDPGPRAAPTHRSEAMLSMCHAPGCSLTGRALPKSKPPSVLDGAVACSRGAASSYSERTQPCNDKRPRRAHGGAGLWPLGRVDTPGAADLGRQLAHSGGAGEHFEAPQRHWQPGSRLGLHQAGADQGVAHAEKRLRGRPRRPQALLYAGVLRMEDVGSGFAVDGLAQGLVHQHWTELAHTCQATSHVHARLLAQSRTPLREVGRGSPPTSRHAA
mmetsp:Transcript_59908/g.128554  ORF Transcript_59908/g.128554 Transcript_59908/m.128554 type:complete len:237 (+) Transcript_59908:14-724(+)